MPARPARDGPVLVQTQAIGICGTDLEIINGDSAHIALIRNAAPKRIKIKSARKIA